MLKRLIAIAILGTYSAPAEEGLRSGHATAQWLVASQEDGVIETVVRLRVDQPWHVYWHNPGEAGMPTSVELKLPDGWKGSALKHPIPKKFKTGGLHGFGHEGTVDYGLTLSAPQGFDGKAELVAVVSWLTCKDDACMPGEIILKLQTTNGRVAGPRIEADAYKVITEQFPIQITPADEVKLKFHEHANQWEFRIENADQLKLDPDQTEVFVETLELVPASSVARFMRMANAWQLSMPKGEYAPQKPDECVILLIEKGKQPVRLEWKRGQ